MPVSLKNTKSLLTGLICVAFAGMFFPLLISNITLILLLVFSLYSIRPAEVLRLIRSSPFMMLMIGFYLLHIAGLLYTDNYVNGLFILEKKISLLLLPLILFPAIIKIEPDLRQILKWTGIITMLSSFVLLVLAVVKTIAWNDPNAFYFENVTSIHYVYYSLYFAIGALITIDVVFDEVEDPRKKVAIILLLFIYSLSFLILVASKTGILAFGLASMIWLYKRLPSKKIFLLSLIILFLSATLLLYLNETTRSRFVGLSEHLSILTLDDFRGQEVYITDLNMRLLFWKISTVNLWRDGAFVAGVGTGDAQDYINALYELPQYNLLGFINWDSHNQWVYTLIQLGIIGVSLLAFLYYRYFIAAWKRGDLKFLIFLIITFAFSMSESILESNKGIEFFGLMITLFCTGYEKPAPTGSAASGS